MPRTAVTGNGHARGVTSADDILMRGIRVIRRVGDDAPWPGVLAAMPDGTMVVLVEAAALGEAWAGWLAPADGHVLAPVDVVRTTTGHAAAIPVCRERLEDLLARRAGAGAVLTEGETLTLAVSLLRGCLQAGATARGTWWVTDDARPVFAESGGEDAAAAAARMLAATGARGSRLAELVAEAATLVCDAPRLAREGEALEERLFAAASPEPLALEVFAPRHSRALSIHTERREPAAVDDAPAGLWHRLIGSVDADLADTVSRATTSVWRRLQRSEAPAKSRKGPLLAAGVVAAVIVGGAALLPAAAEPGVQEITTATPSAPASESPAPADTTSPETGSDPSDPVTVAGDDLALVVSALLEARVACAHDAACLSGILVDPDVDFGAGVIDLPAEERRVTLLDEFGGAAVARVDAADAARPSKLVVVMTREGEWLLRDVHDVAEQP